ncbi:MAG: WG repeat-containing protein [Clostridia bacterium]|nr:WG repeat-containing protein [Clostridia bacterium]
MKKMLAVLIMLCLAIACCHASAENKTDKYNKACDLLSDGKYTEAAALFTELGEYRDAPQMSVYCSSLNAAQSGEYVLAIGGFQALGDFRDSGMQAIYYSALTYEVAEQYENALDLLTKIPFFKDTNSRILTYPAKINERDYAEADRAEQDGELETALAAFKALGNYSDSKARADAVQEKIYARDYAAAERAEKKNQLEQALEGFLALKTYSDSAERAKNVQEKIRARDYATADRAERGGDYAAALSGFTALGDYKDSQERALAVKDKGTYAQALQYAMEGKYAQAYDLFVSLGDYEDSKEKVYTLGVCNFAEITNKGKGVAAFKFHEKYGIINVNTNTTVSPRWDSIGAFDKNGLAMVSENKKNGYIDTNGSIVIPCEWDRISEFEDGFCTVAKANGNNFLFGVCDETGIIISEPQWRTLGMASNSSWNNSNNSCKIVKPSINEGKIKVQNEQGLWGFINTKGEIVGEIRWEKIEGFSEEAAVITESGKYGFLNKDGSVLIEPQYADASSFSGGLAAVKVNGKWGFIDHSNHFVINPYYIAASDFKDGLADVCLSGIGWQIIDSKGTLLYFINSETVSNYEKAVASLNNGEYKEAYALLNKLAGYKDANKLAEEAREKIGAAGAANGNAFVSPLTAILHYWDAKRAVHKSETITIDGEGTYTVSIAGSFSGVDFLNLLIKDEENPEDDVQLKGRVVKIDEILVDGKPIDFAENPTSLCHSENFYLCARIYCPNNDLSYDVKTIDWSGNLCEPLREIINQSSIGSFSSLSITFTVFKPE